MSKLNYLINELLNSNYKMKNLGDFTKYYDINFDILIHNKKIMFIRDKRFNQDIIYKDYLTAIHNINHTI